MFRHIVSLIEKVNLPVDIIFDPPTRMQEMLETEHVEVRDDKVVDFESLVWNPSKHLKEADIDLS